MDLEICQAIQDAQQQSRAAALALVVNTQGSIPRHTGAKMLIYADGSILGSVGGGTFESLVIQDALSCMQTGIAETRTYPLHEASDASFGAICRGEVMVYIEPVKPQPRLYIFGAGHCCLALAKMATQLSWPISVVDDREDIFNTFVYPSSVKQVSATGVDFTHSIQWQTQDIVVLMNKSYGQDQDALQTLLQVGKAAYIGMIGSRRKVEKVLKALGDQGVSVAQLKKVHAPIGLDIGADTPEEIAVSVLAEVLSVLKGGSGKPMAD